MNKHFKLSDGRVLSYREYGRSEGEPLFYFHGYPSSLLEVETFGGERLAEEMNLHLIAIDRPGYGESDGQKNRTLKDWSQDVVEVADGLGWGKFSVLGYSGGGPFALGCANWIPLRLKKVLVISGMGPANAPLFREAPAWTLLKGPGFMRSMIMMGMKKMLDKDPDKFITSMNKNLPPIDKEMMKRSELSQNFISIIKQALMVSSKGALQDAAILRSDWGFSLDGVLHPVDLWHGGQDHNVRFESAEYVASQLPHCETHYFPEEGHISLIGNRFNDILSVLDHD